MISCHVTHLNRQIQSIDRLLTQLSFATQCLADWLVVCMLPILDIYFNRLVHLALLFYSHSFLFFFFSFIVNYSLWINRLAKLERKLSIFDRPLYVLKVVHSNCMFALELLPGFMKRYAGPIQQHRTRTNWTTTSTTTTITRSLNREIERLKLKSIINRGAWNAIRMDTLTVYMLIRFQEHIQMTQNILQPYHSRHKSGDNSSHSYAITIRTCATTNKWKVENFAFFVCFICCVFVLLQLLRVYQHCFFCFLFRTANRK